MSVSSPTYLINLKDETARRTQASAQLRAAGLDPIHIAAVDGRGHQPTEWTCYDPTQARRFFGRQLRGGEVGCYLSHIAALRGFLESGAEQALVLEDDIAINHAGADAIRSALDWLAAHPEFDWDVINLGKPTGKFSLPVKKFGPFRLYRAFYPPLTTTGLAWSRAGAAAFLDQHEGIYAPIDDYLRWWCAKRGRGLAFRPSIVAASGAASSIHPDGSAQAMARSAGWRFKVADLARRARNYKSALLHYRKARLNLSTHGANE